MSDQAGEPVPRPPREGAREARARLVATPLILGVLALLMWLHDATGCSLGTHLLVGLFAAAAGAEVALLFRAAGRPADPREAALACGLLGLVGLVQAAGADPAAWRALLLALAVVAVLVRHLTDTRAEAVDDIAARFVPIVFVGFLLSFLAEFAEHAGTVTWLVLVAKASDMAGWAVGVPLGRHKMVPTVSPGKSWEGTLAGVAASVLTAVLLAGPLGSRAAGGWLCDALFGLTIGCASVLAGVLWSGWKRRLGAKDSSRLIPAMGGVMDMVDSLLLAAPAAHLFLRIA